MPFEALLYNNFPANDFLVFESIIVLWAYIEHQGRETVVMEIDFIFFIQCLLSPITRSQELTRDFKWIKNGILLVRLATITN
jgi:hypothetical protein